MGEPGRWALVLGASSGFGAATALELARAGHDVFGVHLDRKATQPQADAVVQSIRELGREARFFNVNAADDGKRREVVDHAASVLAERGGARIGVLFHSLAFGALKDAVGPDCLTRSQVEMTLDVMAHSLLYWTQELVARDLFAKGAHVLAMTSEGASVAWKGYGAVSAAKAALEAHVRQLAVELGPREIAVNAIRAGVADTPAARKIPAFAELQALCLRRNPRGRLTVPADVARCVAALARPETTWMTGNVIGVDGGEHIAG